MVLSVEEANVPEAQDKPSEVTHVDGVVLVDGPDGIATTLTPKAALETSQRLADKAIEALLSEDKSEDGREANPPG
jgi:hypothetical protein